MGAMLQDVIKVGNHTAQSDPVPMDVDSGIRSRRAVNYMARARQAGWTRKVQVKRHPAREVRVAWHNIARARAVFQSNSGVASDFDNWVLLDSGASVTIISEAFLNSVVQ